jgi:hypothetical protein
MGAEMKLNPTDQKVLDYLHKPRTSEELATYLGRKLPPYQSLRLLQRLDLVDKHGPYPNAKSTFVASGRPMKIDPVYMRVTQTVMGVQL